MGSLGLHQNGDVLLSPQLQNWLEGRETLERHARARVEADNRGPNGAVLSDADLRLLKRRITNRESARRMRRQRTLNNANLQQEVAGLVEWGRAQAAELKAAQQKVLQLETQLATQQRLLDSQLHTVTQQLAACRQGSPPINALPHPESPRAHDLAVRTPSVKPEPSRPGHQGSGLRGGRHPATLDLLLRETTCPICLQPGSVHPELACLDALPLPDDDLF